MRARGRLARVTVQGLSRAVEGCLVSTPRAVVADLTRVTELRASAVPRLGDLVERVRAGCVALHLMTNGGAVDGVLAGALSGGLITVHHSAPRLDTRWTTGTAVMLPITLILLQAESTLD